MRELLEPILRGKFKMPPQATSEDKREIIGMLEQAVAIDVTNVHEWAVGDKHTWQDRLTHLPPRIPFPHLWVEWTEMVPDKGKHFIPVPMGVLVDEIEGFSTGSHRELRDGEFQDGRPGIMRRHSQYNDYDGEPDYYEQALSVFAKSPDGTIMTLGEIESTTHDGNVSFDYLSSDPDDFSRSILNPVPAKTDHAEFYADPQLWAQTRTLETYLPMLVFMNCRNVTLNRLERPQKTQKKFEKRYKVTRPSFHVIEVHKSMVRNVYEQGVASESVTHAHMVRGHVKRYGEHNKLFGKVAGNWFWQSHVRGDIGTPAVSDYRVWGTTPNHARRCSIREKTVQ